MHDTGGHVPCATHPNVMTGLRCTRCGKPICPACAVRTPVGLRCPQCAGVRTAYSGPRDTRSLTIAGGASLVVALVVALLWQFMPDWGFYLSLLMGFGVVETVARFTNGRRGNDLILLGAVVITIGFAASRLLLMQRFGIDLTDLQQSARAVRVSRLTIMPDVVYMGLAYLIAWVRFK